jgi:hypothetical protein
VSKPDFWLSRQCLVSTYDKLGRHADAQSPFAKVKTLKGDNWAYQYVDIYAQSGDIPKTLEWLATAMRLRDTGLVWLKVDPQLAPLRNEPRFQAALRALKFPD